MGKKTKFTYYGGMCVLVERSDGFKMLFDPYIKKTSRPMPNSAIFLMWI